MKRFFYISFILIVVLVTSILAIGIKRKIQDQKMISMNIARFPDVSFMTLSDEVFNSTSIKQGPVLVVHYHPECEHCQYEIPDILRSEIPTSFARVILVSSASVDSIRNFIRRNNLPNYPTVLFLVDASYKFVETFGISTIPSSYIYDRKLKLVKAVHGEIKAEAILKYLNESEHLK